MNHSQQTYYQAEMQILGEALDYFANQHQDAAARMGVDPRSRDPQIEMLLNGCAYLQARVKEQIDIGVHHVSEALLRHVASELMMPRPAKTIIEFTSIQQRLVDAEHLPAQIKLSSKPVGDEQSIMEFETEQPITIYPFSLAPCELETNGKGQSVLKLKFILNEGVNPLSIQPQILPLYINAPQHLCRKWKSILLRQVTNMTLKQRSGDEYRLGGQERVTAVSEPCHSAHSVSRAGQLYRLGEYFYFPESSHFVQLDLSSAHIAEDSFCIYLTLSENISASSAPGDLFKLHCVPACNRFIAHAEPIRYQRKNHGYSLVIDSQKPNSQSLLDVQAVIGINTKTSETIAFYDFFKSSFPANSHHYYRLSQQGTPGQLPAYTLTFSGELPETMYISSDVVACNGQYPWLYLSKNDLKLNDDSVSLHVAASNLLKPCRYAYKPINKEFAAKALSIANATLQRLTDIQCLKQLLSLFDWDGAKSHEIESILKAGLHPVHQVRRGILCQRIICEIMIEEKQFNCLDSLYSFGDFLHFFLKLFTPMNIPLDTKLVTHPAKEILLWHG